MVNFYCKNHHKVKDNKSGVDSSTKSVVTFHKCVKSGYLKSNFKSNRNGYDGGLLMTSTIKLPKWVTKKPMISDVEVLTKATMNCNKNQKKLCTSCNEGNCAWGYQWKFNHR